MRKILDVRRLLCPLPVIRLADTILLSHAQDEVEVVGTDPGMLQDVPAWCRVHGHKVIATHQNSNEIRMTVLVCQDV